MRKILLMIVVVGITQIVWGNSPRIIEPRENAVILNNQLFLFIEPYPQDIIDQNFLFIEIYSRNTGKISAKMTLSSSQNYQYSLDIQSWDKGKYLMKAIYVDKNGKHLTKSSWRNFTIG